MPKSQIKELCKAQKELCRMKGDQKYILTRFGYYLAEKEGYKQHKGLDALYYYLVQKHHWLPSQAKSLSIDDLQFLFAEELQSWTLSKDEIC